MRASMMPWRELAPVLAALTALAACSEATTPSWQLRHDRIMAVRASAPGLAPGEQATIDVLVASEAAGAAEVTPMLVGVLPATPAPLADAVAPTGAGWQVTAPSEDALVAARAALGLDVGAPVPLGLVVTVAIGDQVFVATKTVYLGATAANPAIAEVRVDGAATGDAPATAATGEVELAIDAAADDSVAWFTSVGELSDEEDAVAHLTAEAPAAGQIAVVVRDGDGGVAWRVVALQIE